MSVSSEIILGDCLTVLPQLPEKSFDAAITSPPYNLGIKYSSYNDKRSNSAYLAWFVEWAMLLRRVLKDSGSFFLNIGGSPSKPWLPYEVALAARSIFTLQNVFHWVKAVTVGGRSHGHFKPVNSARYVTSCHEFIFHFSKTGTAELDRLSIGVPYQDKSNISRWKHTADRDQRCRGNVWYAPYDTIQNRAKERPHPATFPVAIAENCIRICSAKSVIDPFAGLGTTGIAARNCGAEFTGIEIDPHYVEIAKIKLNGQTNS